MARLAFLPTDIWPTLAKVNKSHENHQIDLCISSYCSIFEFADFSKPNGKWCHRPLLNWLILSLSLFLSLISSFTLILSLWHWTESFIMLEHLRNRASCKFFFQLSACKFNGRSMSCLLLAIARVQKPTTWGPWQFFLCLHQNPEHCYLIHI